MFSVLDTNLLIQAHWRGRVMRNEFLDIKKKAIIVQSYFRMQRALKEYKIISDQRQVAAILIQSWVRRFLAQNRLRHTHVCEKEELPCFLYWIHVVYVPF